MIININQNFLLQCAENQSEYILSNKSLDEYKEISFDELRIYYYSASKLTSKRYLIDQCKLEKSNNNEDILYILMKQYISIPNDECNVYLPLTFFFKAKFESSLFSYKFGRHLKNNNKTWICMKDNECIFLISDIDTPPKEFNEFYEVQYIKLNDISNQNNFTNKDISIIYKSDNNNINNSIKK